MKATRAEIVRALRTRRSDSAISRDLGCDRHRVTAIRQSLGLPRVSNQPLTLQQKWASFTRPAGGGHVEWTGERQSTSGTPVMRYREKPYTAARVAFIVKYGREPVGYTFAECGMRHCVAPDHVDDEPGRARAREQLRYLTGRGERPDVCVAGHDQSAHGRYEADGRAYCAACKRERKNSSAGPVHGAVPRHAIGA